MERLKNNFAPSLRMFLVHRQCTFFKYMARINLMLYCTGDLHTKHLSKNCVDQEFISKC